MISLRTNTGTNDVTVPCECPKGMEFFDCDDIPAAHPNYRQSILPLPPEPVRKPGRLGQIVWPCWGLTRYAVGHVVVSGENLRKMLDVADWAGDVGYQYVQVILEDDRATPFELSMYVASIRPFNDPRETMAETIAADDDRLFVLTLADTRHFNANDPNGGNVGTPGSPRSWGEAIHGSAYWIDGAGSLPSAASIDALLNATSPHYPLAAAEWWNSTNLQKPSYLVFADAAAAAVNLRLVYDGEGVTLQDHAAAKTAWDSWCSTWGIQSETGGLFEVINVKPYVVEFSFTSRDRWTELRKFLSNYGTSIRVDLNYLSSSSDRNDYRDRFAADIERWCGIRQFNGTICGLIPLPGSAVPYSVVWTDDGMNCNTRIESGPFMYPWPLTGRQIVQPAPYSNSLVVSGSGLTTADLLIGQISSIPAGKYAVQCNLNTQAIVHSTIGGVSPPVTVASIQGTARLTKIASGGSAPGTDIPNTTMPLATTQWPKLEEVEVRCGAGISRVVDFAEGDTVCIYASATATGITYNSFLGSVSIQGADSSLTLIRVGE